MNFAVGDVVWLKTGGPAMTVASVDLATREVRCTWFATIGGEQQVEEHAFGFGLLTSNDPAARPAGVPATKPEYKVYEEGDD